MNTPNKITVFRIFLVPVFLAVYLLDLPYNHLISAAIFGLAAATDAVDGHLARKNNIITVFGKFLDPIADKMLVTAGLLAFMQDGLCNIWIVLAILVREVVMTSLRLIASAQGVVIPANVFGKIKKNGFAFCNNNRRSRLYLYFQRQINCAYNKHQNAKYT